MVFPKESREGERGWKELVCVFRRPSFLLCEEVVSVETLLQLLPNQGEPGIALDLGLGYRV